MEKWFVAAKKADFAQWSRKFHIDQVLARIIRNRDVESEADVEKFLHGNMKDVCQQIFSILKHFHIRFMLPVMHS